MYTHNFVSRTLATFLALLPPIDLKTFSYFLLQQIKIRTFGLFLNN